MDAEPSSIVNLEEARSEPYATILSYPRNEEDALNSRIHQLKELGVSQLEFKGRLRLGRLSLLGKGVAGVVIAGRSGSEQVAIKIRRTDSRRDNLAREASMLKAANETNVGPRYLLSTPDVIIMEFIEGRTLPEWIDTLKGRGQRSRLRQTVSDIFQQCFRLDSIGIDHGELSRAHKNVIVRPNGMATILDFESASVDRVPHNVTSIGQYFFLGNGFGKRVRRIVGPTDEERLKGVLQGYKLERSLRTFRIVEEFLRLQ